MLPGKLAKEESGWREVPIDPAVSLAYDPLPLVTAPCDRRHINPAAAV